MSSSLAQLGVSPVGPVGAQGGVRTELNCETLCWSLESWEVVSVGNKTQHIWCQECGDWKQIRAF